MKLKLRICSALYGFRFLKVRGPCLGPLMMRMHKDYSADGVYKEGPRFLKDLLFLSVPESTHVRPHTCWNSTAVMNWKRGL